MNSVMLVLAAVCFIVAIWAVCRRDGPTAAAGVAGAVLFAILAIITGENDRGDC